jgi:hypothetical protein
MLTPGEQKLLQIFLEDYADVLGNRGCNDLTDEMRACLTEDEWKELDKQFHAWNGDPEEHNDRSHKWLMDFCVLYYLKKKIGL